MLFDAHLAADVLLSGGFAATAAGLIRQTRRNRALQRQIGQVNGELTTAQRRFGALDAETAHLAQQRLPAAFDAEARRYPDVVVPRLAHRELAGSPADVHHQAVVDLFREGIGTVRTEVARSARSTVRDLLESPQTLLTRTQFKITEEMEAHPQASSYVEGLMAVDHLVTKAVHAVQRLRILTGSWPGLQRGNATLYDIVESARGRIDAPNRVVHTHHPRTGGVWIASRAVEPLSVALAELLDNAVSFSAGDVYVQIMEARGGYCLVVDDAGHGLNVYQREEAARKLSQNEVLDVTTLTDSLQLGWHVVARLGAEYGFRADISMTSAYGGTRAVLLVPTPLQGDAVSLQQEAAARRPSSTVPGARHEATPLPEAEPPATPAASSTTTAGLPQRRRRQPLPAEERPETGRFRAETTDPDTFAAGLSNLAAAFHTPTHDDAPGGNQ